MEKNQVKQCGISLFLRGSDKPDAAASFEIAAGVETDANGEEVDVGRQLCQELFNFVASFCMKFGVLKLGQKPLPDPVFLGFPQEGADVIVYSDCVLRLELDGQILDCPMYTDTYSVLHPQLEFALSVFYGQYAFIDAHRDPPVPNRLTELRLFGSVYTDIKYQPWEDPIHVTDHWNTSLILEANKNGSPTTEFFLGPCLYPVRTQNGYEYGENNFCPGSCGIVSFEEMRKYMGDFPVIEETVRKTQGEYDPEDDSDGFRISIGDTTYFRGPVRSHVHAFCDLSGGDVTISVFYNGRMHRKITKTDDWIVFHATRYFTTPYGCVDSEGYIGPFNLNEPEETSLTPQDIVFQMQDGKYRYTTENQDLGESRFSGVTFTPPETPRWDESGRFDAKELCQDLCRSYVEALHDAFSNAEGYTLEVGGCIVKEKTWSEPSGLSPQDFVLIMDSFAPPTEAPSRQNSYLRESYSFENIPPYIRALTFAQGKTAAVITIQESLELLISVGSSELPLSELRKSMFPGLPETIRTSKRLDSVMRQMDIFQAIKQEILDFGVAKFGKFLYKKRQPVSFKKMKDLLYDEEGMIVDPNFVTFAMGLQDRYFCTKEIANVALLGQAGAGKSKMLTKLAKAVYSKEVMHTSPSDWKPAYLGQSLNKIVPILAKAAREKKIIFIDEAYELMSDEYGREAVSTLLPLMTGDKPEISVLQLSEENESKKRKTLSVNYAKGVIEEDGKKICDITSGPPAIWIAGYEDDMRLMLKENQGLYRRFELVELKTPTAKDLYQELLDKAKRVPDTLQKEARKKEKPIDEDIMQDLRHRSHILFKQFRDNEKLIKNFIYWGSLPQNSKYFASHAGIDKFVERCLYSVDFSRSRAAITSDISNIITSTKRDIKHQLDTLRRAAGGGDADFIQMITDSDIRLDHLKGTDAQRDYLSSVIDMYLDKSRFDNLNMTIPRGVLLYGPPGTGKSFIARAMAGEIQERFEKNAPDKRVGFMSVSGAELISRPISCIASLFDKAEEYDLCVIFLDEVDAIAKTREQNPHYAYLLELIRQMDGVDRRTNIFMMAATNARASLDEAFTRAGRLDKHLFFGLPERNVRRDLAATYLQARCQVIANCTYEHYQEQIDALAEKTAGLTAGCTPGDIENIINTACLLYDKARPAKDQETVTDEDLDVLKQLEILEQHILEAVERHHVGELHLSQREETFQWETNDESCSATSIHEVGHALVSLIYGFSFDKITSLPRGDALGYVMSSEQKLRTKADYEKRIRGIMGGRAAEEIVYGADNVSTGAYSDIENATRLANLMVQRCGFSGEYAFMSVGTDAESKKVVSQLLNRLYRETQELLSDKKELIIQLAEEVFRKESMSGEEFTQIYQSMSTSAPALK